ncbi:MAG TPA: hypothetical protein VL625_13070 [Patescibacteria group bacterium]|nr:hypothetical protein [Patescibacteria group bacterium]
MVTRKIKKALLAVACFAVLCTQAVPADAQGFFRRGGGHRWQQQDNGGGPGMGQDQGGGQEDFSNPDRRRALKEQLMQLPPDQRRQRIQELREQFQAKREQRREKFEGMWEKASPEQKSKFCSNIAAKCTGEAAGKPGCQLAQQRCNGNR